jgi:hypothetical protein
MRPFTGTARVVTLAGGSRRLILRSPTGEEVYRDFPPDEWVALMRAATFTNPPPNPPPLAGEGKGGGAPAPKSATPRKRSPSRTAKARKGK